MRKCVSLVAACVLACAVAGCGSTVATATGPSPAKCPVTLSAPATPVSSSGTTATVAVATEPECAWSAASEASWISGLTPASGQGSGQLQMQVAANPDASARQGDIIVNGEHASIRQDAAACHFELSSTEQTIPASGGSVGITVTTARDCAWTTQEDSSWIAITAGATGTGAGNVIFEIAPNTGTTRTASISVAGQTVRITQRALVAPPPPNCSYTLSPRNISVPASAAETTPVSVTTAAGCEWVATSNASWLSIIGRTSGSGSGTVTFSIAANTGAIRTGTLTIAGETLTVTQAAASNCSFSVSPSTLSIAATGSSGTSISVTASAGCTWTSVSNAAWISVTSGASGSGNGTVKFSVAANSGAGRTGTLTVAGQTITVNQAAAPCSYSVTPTSVSVGAAGGSGTPISVSTASGCAWTAMSKASWVTVLTGASGTGSGSVTYSVQTNSGGARTGTLTVAGQTVTISQSAACVYAISPMSATFDRAGGTGGPVTVTTQSTCAWTAVSNVTWITLTSGSSGTGNGNVTFTVAANNTGADRTGTLSIAGLTFTVNQKH
jgi:all-beta uncharacterized protein/BACON domain-containing protein